jgi:hypothetical protein
MRSHDGAEGEESAGTRDAGWTEPPTRTSRPREAPHPSAELLDALDQSLQIAESARHEVEGAAKLPRGRRPLSARRRLAAALRRFAPYRREMLGRRAGSFVALCAAAAAVGWLIARLLG